MSGHGTQRFFAITLLVLIPLYAALPNIGQAAGSAAGTAPLIYHLFMVAKLLWRRHRPRGE